MSLATLVSTVLLFFGVGLVLGDAIVTQQGFRRGFHEVNPVLRFVHRRFGLAGLAVTRIAALSLLLLLFWLLEPWTWVLFSCVLLIVMGFVVLVGVRRLTKTKRA